MDAAGPPSGTRHVLQRGAPGMRRCRRRSRRITPASPVTIARQNCSLSVNVAIVVLGACASSARGFLSFAQRAGGGGRTPRRPPRRRSRRVPTARTRRGSHLALLGPSRVTPPPTWVRLRLVSHLGEPLLRCCDYVSEYRVRGS